MFEIDLSYTILEVVSKKKLLKLVRGEGHAGYSETKPIL
jgi:hypothetical protein